jgi:hypothetical protein
MVCLCGRSIWDDINDLLDTDTSTVTYRKWQQYSISSLSSHVADYNIFKSMIHSLQDPNAEDAVLFLRSHFAGYLDDVEVGPMNMSLANFLTTEGVLSTPYLSNDIYRMSSSLIDGLVRTLVIPRWFPDAPSIPLPYQNSGDSLHVLNVLIESLKFFDKQFIQLAPRRSFKSCIYDTELMRILTNWLARQYGWMVTGQWHLRNEDRWNSIILKHGDEPIVLELLATGDRHLVESHIQKTSEYKAVLFAVEAWVIHFTCETDYQLIWQSGEQLHSGLNVAHFMHNQDFTEVQAWVRWRDETGAPQNFEELPHI